MVIDQADTSMFSFNIIQIEMACADEKGAENRTGMRRFSF